MTEHEARHVMDRRVTVAMPQAIWRFSRTQGHTAARRCWMKWAR